MAADDEHALATLASGDAAESVASRAPAAEASTALHGFETTGSPRAAATAHTVRRAVSWHRALVRATLARETADRLIAGGDARIALADDGLNRYGCGDQPDPTLYAFGSSTASVVSAHAFAAARGLTARLVADPSRVGLEQAAIHDDILALTGASGVAGVQAIVAASGTDLHLIAVHLSAAHGPIGTVTVDAVETGTGVLPALAMTHFGRTTARGAAVTEGAPIGAAEAASVQGVRLRHFDGSPRESTDVDADFERHVEAIVRTGARALLSLTDLTKTGLVAPSVACATRLLARHAGRLDVLVDACQFRLSPATVSRYLEHGFMVAVTGSKFVGGPAFCGALLLPASIAQRARGVALGPLTNYTVRGDWPADWHAADALDPSHNVGLMTRWSAAIAELKRLRTVSDVMIARDLDAFADAVVTRLANDPAFEALPAPAIIRTGPIAAWDAIPTLFSFVVYRPAGDGQRTPLSMSETAALHVRMRHPVEWPDHADESARAIARMRFQIGQPVACGMRAGVDVSALRLGASARTLTDASARADGIAPAIRQAMRAFDKLALLAGWAR